MKNFMRSLQSFTWVSSGYHHSKDISCRPQIRRFLPFFFCLFHSFHLYIFLLCFKPIASIPSKTIIRDNAGKGYDYLSDDFQLQKSTNILKLEILTKFSCSVMWIMLRKISFLSILSKLCFLLGIKVQHWILELSANRIDSDIPV